MAKHSNINGMLSASGTADAIRNKFPGILAIDVSICGTPADIQHTGYRGEPILYYKQDQFATPEMGRKIEAAIDKRKKYSKLLSEAKKLGVTNYIGGKRLPKSYASGVRSNAVSVAALERTIDVAKQQPE